MKKFYLLTKTLLAVALLCVGQNAWADNTVQNFGSTETTSWTASSSTTNIKYGSTVTLKGLVMTFGGGTYTSAQTVGGDSYSEDFWTWNSSNSTIQPRFMPNNDDTSSNGVASIAVNDVLPTNGAVYKFVLSEPGVLTISGKGGTTNGKIMLVQADNDNKVTTIVDEGSATDKEVEKTYTLDAGTYYFFQCAHNETTVSGYRYGLKSISFATLTAVSAATTWDFSSLSFSKSTTDFQLLADNTIYVGANVDRENNQRAVFSANLDPAPTALGEKMLAIKTGVAGQVVMRLKAYDATVAVSDGTSVIATFVGGTKNGDSRANASYHGGGTYYKLATFQADADKTYYIYGTAGEGTRQPGVFHIEFHPYGNTTTALTESKAWDFTATTSDGATKAQLENFYGITYQNFYFGTGLTWTYNTSNSSSRLLFNGNGNTITGEKTFSFKVAANTGGEIVITPSCWYSSNNNTTTNMKLNDGTSDLMEFNSSHHGKETTIIIAPAATERTLTFYQTNSSATNVGIQKISWNPVTSVSATTGANGFTTFASPYPLDLANLPNGLEAYTATLAETTLSFTQKTTAVAAGTGLLLKGAYNTAYNIPVVASGSNVEGNALIGVTNSTTSLQSVVDGTYYFVMKKAASASDALSFAPISTSTAVTMPSGKAYVELPAENNARALRISFDGITGVDNVEAAAEVKAQDGKFIENGKIVIVKNGKKFNANGQQVK